MTGRLTSANTPSLSSDNQPIDLAQKSQATRNAETTKGGSATYVHYASNASSNVMSNISVAKNEISTNVPTVALVSRHPGINNQISTGVLNLTQPTCNTGFSSGSISGIVRSVANSTSTSLTMVSASSTSSPVTVPSGYHIPRGAAVVANMTASRSQNLTSIVKTSSQPLGISNSATSATPRTGLVTQRVVPISSSSWINRNSSATPVLANKVSTPQTSGRATITTARPVQSPVMPPTTYHSGTVKPGAIVAANIRSPGSAGVRIGSGMDGIRPHVPKGLQISHPVSHVGQKYIGTGVGGTVRGVNAGALASSGNNSSLYSPTSTLVTSLASSGTTITPHPGNRNQVPPNTLRITSASSFAQVPSQSNPSLCGISLTPPTGAILNQHQTSRNQPSEHHLPIKTPVVRAPYAASSSPAIKGSSTTLPAGTQISFTGSKMIAHPTQGQSLAVAQISNVTNLKHGAVITTAQSASNSTPFQSRTVTTVGPNIGKIGGPAISMTKVIPKAKMTQNLGTSAGISSHSPVSAAGATNFPVDTQPPHTSVFLHRTQHSVPGTTGGVVTQSDRIITTVPQYSISTPYYLDPQNQGSFPVSASLVPYSITQSHYIPTTVTSGAIQVGGNVVSSNVTSSETSVHQGTMPIMKANSSPRPSILRKRSEMDGSPLKAAKNLAAALNIPISSPPSPKRPDSRGNGNASSGSTTISANSSPGVQILEEDTNVSLSKTSLRPGSLDDDTGSSCLVGRSVESLTNCSRTSKAYNFSQLSDQYLLNVPQTMDGVSPRKKPRKQQLMGNELQESPPCEDEIEPPVSKKRRDTPMTQPVLMNMEVEEDEKHSPSWGEAPEVTKAETPREMSSPSPEPVHKKPHMSLINSYKQSWKPRHNHFARHSDLRPKEEKKKTVNEIAGQKMAMQRVNGWKVMHISGQVEDLVDLEGEVANRLRVLLKTIEKRSLSRKPFKDFDKDVDRLSELVKANIQRSIIIKDQMADAKFQMSRLFEHKDNVVEILTKYSNKRILRKKDKI